MPARVVEAPLQERRGQAEAGPDQHISEGEQARRRRAVALRRVRDPSAATSRMAGAALGSASSPSS